MKGYDIVADSSKHTIPTHLSVFVYCSNIAIVKMGGRVCVAGTNSMIERDGETEENACEKEEEREKIKKGGRLSLVQQTISAVSFKQLSLHATAWPDQKSI